MSPPNHVFRVRFNSDAIVFGDIKNETITGEWFGNLGSLLPCWQVYRLFLKFLLKIFVLLVNFKREHFLMESAARTSRLVIWRRPQLHLAPRLQQELLLEVGNRHPRKKGCPRRERYSSDYQCQVHLHTSSDSEREEIGLYII